VQVTTTPLAFESLGVRSMCTLVSTKDVSVLLDAGVALGPRFRLMPHPREYEALANARQRIEEAALNAEVVTVSHYHNDHHTPGYLEPVWLGSSPASAEKIYSGKLVLVKDARQKVNTSQRRRGWMFRQSVGKLASRLEVADGQSFDFGRTRLRFPGPVPHGEDGTELGWVLPCVVERSREKVMFAPDAQGPVSQDTVKLILAEEPDLLVTSGPPTYLRGFKIGDDFFQTALSNMQVIVEKVETVVVDHHLLRDEGWKGFLEPVEKVAERAGHRVITAAELLDHPAQPLECQRRRMYEEEPPSAEFVKWAELPKEKQASMSPPL